MRQQIFTKFPLLMGLGLAVVITTFGLASAAASAREAGVHLQKLPELAELTIPPALPAQLQSTPTATATIQSIPSVIIVSPSTDQTFNFGELIPVVSRSADPQGINRVELMINGKLVARRSNIKAPTNKTLTTSHSWLPEIVGNQVIQVVAYNAAGVTGESEFVFVQVLPTTPTPAPASPTPTPTPTPTYPYVVVASAGALRVRSGPGTQYDALGSLLPQQQAQITGRTQGADLWWQIKFPLGTETLGWISGNPAYATAYYADNVPAVAVPPTPTPPATPTPSSGIDFRVDRTEILQGECVTFSWNVYGVQAVYFQGEGVTGEDQSRECPQDSTTYSLQVERADGTSDMRTIEIKVSDSDTGYATSTVSREDEIDFDNGAQTSEQDNDFFWYFEGDQPLFEKTDVAENDLKLAAFQKGDLDDFQNLSQDTCRGTLEQHDQPRITIALDLIVCFSTDQEQLGKLRFTGGNSEELIMQWHLW